MENLQELKTQVLGYCEKHKSNGGLVAEYQCPHCNSSLLNIIPNKKDEVWDSATKCYECGKLHFVVKKVEGIFASTLT